MDILQNTQLKSIALLHCMPSQRSYEIRHSYHNNFCCCMCSFSKGELLGRLLFVNLHFDYFHFQFSTPTVITLKAINVKTLKFHL